METRDFDLIGEFCSEAHRLAVKQGDPLLAYVLGMALVAARDAKRRKKPVSGRKVPARRRRAA